MPPPGHLLTFAVMAAVLIAIPGPSVLFTVSRALTVGRRGALLTVLGNAGGLYVQVLTVALGVGAVVARSAEVFTALKLVGAAYLAFLGVQAIRHRRLATDPRPAAVAGTYRVLREGFVVGVTNPKMIVFLAVALPQFVEPSAGRVPLQMLVLGLVVLVIALASDAVWALAAGTAREWFARSPRRVELVRGSGGVSMIGLGAGLALTGRPH
jgi:threonine/homoserine/homoserine lactone efflux protein